MIISKLTISEEQVVYRWERESFRAQTTQLEFTAHITQRGSFTYEVVSKVTLEIIMDGWLWSYGLDSFLRETQSISGVRRERRRDFLFEVASSSRVSRISAMIRVGICFFIEKSKSPTIGSGWRGPRGRPGGTGDRGIGKRRRRYRWTMVEAAASILSSPLSPTSSSSTTLSSSGRLLHVAIAYSQPCHYHEAILHAG